MEVRARVEPMSALLRILMADLYDYRTLRIIEEQF